MLDLSQLIINDLFEMIASSLDGATPTTIVQDFVKSFYPDIQGAPKQVEKSPSKASVANSKQQSPRSSRSGAVSNKKRPADETPSPVKNTVSIQDGYQSFDTFGGDQPFLISPPSMVTLSQANMRVSRHRSPGQTGFGVFEKIGGDLSLVRPGLEHSDTDALKEVKELCVKIYRATNMRFQ